MLPRRQPRFPPMRICGPHIFFATPNHSVALRAQLIHFGLHPSQQLFRRSGRYAGPLRRPNVLPLAVDLPARMFDFCSYGGIRPAEYPKKRLRSG